MTKLKQVCQECGVPMDLIPLAPCVTHNTANRPKKFVPEALRKAAAIYEERNKLYGDNYKNFGKLLAALFPDGISIASAQDPVAAGNRLGVLIQILSKITRYCENFNTGGHADSLDDLAVYAMMLRELDAGAIDRPDIGTY